MFNIDEYSKTEEIRELLIWLECATIEEIVEDGQITEEEIEGTIKDYKLILKKAEEYEYAKKLYN